MTNTEKKKLPAWVWGVALFAILLLVDQVTKMVADWYFNLPDAPRNVVVIPNLIYLTISYNRGIAYGIAADADPALKLTIIIATAVMMIGIAVWYFFIDSRRTVVRAGLVMVFSGGIGNLIDRLYYQVWDPATATGFRDGVRDMVDLNAFGFAVCNFADFFIVLGAIVLLVGFIFFDIDAMFPMGKYKQLSEQAEKEEAEKKAKKEQLQTAEAAPAQAPETPEDNKD